MVTLNVSAGLAGGRELIVLPNVVGQSTDAALAQLQHFRVERRLQPSSQPAGVVLLQTPTGRAPAGSRVTLVVSSGRWTEVYEMPDLVGRSADEAQAQLAEFTLETSRVISAEPYGQVISHNPPAGAGVAPGSLVRLQLSDGSLVRVPAVVDTSLADARARVSELRGVRLVVVGGEADGTIVAQQPPPGAEVARGSDLVVSVHASPLAGRITGIDRGAGGSGLLRWFMLALAALAAATLAWAWHRRQTSPAPAVWDAKAQVDRSTDEVTAQGGVPRGPEIGVQARLEHGSVSTRVDGDSR